MSKHPHTNSLINETSPYLLQHAHNPVNWHAWGDEALQKAKAEDKPILVSIGYSACHWCHVMERESFEDEAIAEIMNSNFINIKIDREERPDIDHIYMDAVQAITGSGGWPLNVFLTPEMKPFYGGTYFPPKPVYNRNSWREILLAVAHSYKEKRNEITEQSEKLTQYLQQSGILNKDSGTVTIGPGALNAVAESLSKLADKVWGGFGQAPKFPQTFSILYLLRHSFFTGDKDALNTATVCLDKMMMGGIYDHLGGGFSRYSTDTRWQIPHFEKMLYDNALLIDVFTEAYQLTKKQEYKTVVEETIRFIKREMTSPGGGFYSALDADSEGVEGKCYTWEKKEIDEILAEDSNLFCLAYDISETGNWEHTNILWLPSTWEAVAEKAGMDKEQFIKRIGQSKEKLFNERQKRTRPALDNKILLGWNALMTISICNAYAAFGNEEYLKLAKTNIAFIEQHLLEPESGLLHSWNNKPNRQPAFLEDYAALIKAYILLHQVTADTGYLLKAKSFTERAIDLFSDEQTGFFYFVSKEQTDILLRKTEIYDGATPSGNSLMAANLLLLSVFFDIPEWRQRTEGMLGHVKNFVEKYPISFGLWALCFQFLVYGLKEIVVMGENCNNLVKQILQEYIPLKIIQSSSTENDNWPLLREKVILSNQTKIYICENYACQQPAESFQGFKNQLIEHF